MTAPKPHFLLFCDGNASTASESANANRGRWKFVLENVETGERSEATDTEPSIATDRCSLVSVLRGLESLEQPSRVTLVTTSRYVTRGLQYGLTEWRDNDFSWEHFGAVQPIRNADIWRRIDRTLAFHQVQCRWMSHEELPAEEPIDDRAEVKPMTSRSVTIAPVVTSTASHTSSSTNSQATLAVASLLPTEKTANIPFVLVKKHQRVYTDTPVANSCVAKTDHNLKQDRVLASKHSMEKPIPTRPRNVAERPSIWTQIRLIASYPWRIGRLTLSYLWIRILDLDECLESYLKCMLLLEPTSQRTKDKN